MDVLLDKVRLKREKIVTVGQPDEDKMKGT